MKTKILFSVIFISMALSAHPHVFINNTVTPIIEDGELSGLKVAWVFDSLSSSMFMKDIDKNENKKLESNEITFLEEEIFSGLFLYSYFTDIFFNSDSLPISKVQNLQASMLENEKLQWRFVIPLDKKSLSSGDVLNVSQFDPDVYIAFEGSGQNKDSSLYQASETTRTVENPTWGKIQVPVRQWKIK